MVHVHKNLTVVVQFSPNYQGCTWNNSLTDYISEYVNDCDLFYRFLSTRFVCTLVFSMCLCDIPDSANFVELFLFAAS